MAKDRTWLIPAHPDTGTVDPDAFAQAMVEASSTLLTVGGVLNVAPVREVVDTEFGDLYVTRAVLFTWQSFVPALERRWGQQQEGSESEPEPERNQTGDVQAEGFVGPAHEPEDDGENFPDHPSLAEPQPAGA